MITSKGENLSWVGVRAPKLWREKEPVWDKPITLFNGKDLTGWETLGTKKNQWIVEDGALKSPKSGANIRTKTPTMTLNCTLNSDIPKKVIAGYI